MAAPTIDHEKVTFGFTDGSENSVSSSHYVPLGTAYADCDALFDALNAVSTIALERMTFSYMGADPTNNGAAGVYAEAEDVAVIELQAGDNSIVPFSIPGPMANIFAADGKTVNPVAATVAALLVEILAIIVTKGGVILVDYVRGYRKARKPRKTKPGVTYNAAR